MAQQTICPACGAPLTYSGTAEEIRCPFCDTELQVLHENGQERFRILSQPGPQKEVLSRPVEPRPAESQQQTVYSGKSPAEVDQPPAEPGQPAVEGGQPPAERGARTEETPRAQAELPDIPAVVPPDAAEDFHNRPTTVMRREDFTKEGPLKEERPREPARLDDSTRETVMSARPPAAEEDKQTAPGYPGFISNEADRQAFSPERLRAEHTAETVSVPDTPAFYQMHGPKEVPATGAAAEHRRRSNLVPIILALIIGLIILMACGAGAWMMLSRFVRAA